MATKPPAKAFAHINDQIRNLAKMLDETGLHEIAIKADGQEITVKRQAVVANTTPTANTASTFVNDSAETKAAPAAGDKYQNHPGAVTSPMVGTIYIAPEPGASPFVQKDDKVKKGQVLFIVEAMKTMNNIVAPADGRIHDILVSNEQPIEFGEILAIIE